jgi:hypothetical protein
MASKAERLVMEARSSRVMISLLRSEVSGWEPGSDPDAQADSKRVTARSDTGNNRIGPSLVEMRKEGRYRQCPPAIQTLN